eukprot:COSAG05_NODE_18749_length_303_cov_1.254902_1_plen_100_part_11
MRAQAAAQAAEARAKLAKVPLFAKLLAESGSAGADSAGWEVEQKNAFLGELERQLGQGSFASGEPIVTKGEMGDTMYFILSGAVGIYSSLTTSHAEEEED